MTDEPVEFVEEIKEALVVRPGDKLLVRVHPATHPEDIADLLERLKRRLPEVEITAIGAEQITVIRGDEP